MTNLKAARVIEVGTPEQNVILIRARRGDPFIRIGVVADGEAEADETHFTFYEDELRRGDQMTVLAEFPLTLASLLPEGCTRFECWNKAGTTVHYARRESPAVWVVNADPMEETWRLEDIAERFDLDVRTVVPLQVHADWVEAQR